MAGNVSKKSPEGRHTRSINRPWVTLNFFLINDKWFWSFSAYIKLNEASGVLRCSANDPPGASEVTRMKLENFRRLFRRHCITTSLLYSSNIFCCLLSKCGLGLKNHMLALKFFSTCTQIFFYSIFCLFAYALKHVCAPSMRSTLRLEPLLYLVALKIYSFASQQGDSCCGAIK